MFVLYIIYKKLDFSNPGCLMLKSVYNKLLNNKIYLLHATIEPLLCTRFNVIFISIVILHHVVFDEIISKLPPPTLTYLPVLQYSKLQCTPPIIPTNICVLVEYCCTQCIDSYNDPSWFLFQTLAEIDKWGIDIFRIADLTNNRPLTAIAYTVFQVTTNNNNSNNNDSNGGDEEETTAKGSYYTAAVVAPLVCHAVNRTVRANGLYLFLSFSEPRAFENVYDSG